MAAKSSDRRGTKISLVAIHTNEGPNPSDVFPDRTAENLAKWMDGQNVSYHKIIDDDSIVHYVPDERYTWSLRSGNARSLNLCFTGYAGWPRAEWLRHQRMLEQGAGIVREWCRRWRIPIVKLSSSEVGKDFAGIIGHVNWTEGKRDGSHTDPGSNFPWDVFMNMVRGSNAPEEDDLKQDERDALFDIREQLTGSRTPGQYPGWPARTDPDIRATVTDYLRAIHYDLASLGRMIAEHDQKAESSDPS